MTRDQLLWTGVLLPPLAWALNLSVNYFLASAACTGAWPLTLHAVTVLTLAAAAGGGLISWRAWPEREAPADEAGIGRQQFMAAGGISFALIFELTIVAQWYPAFMIEPCRV